MRKHAADDMDTIEPPKKHEKERAKSDEPHKEKSRDRHKDKEKHRDKDKRLVTKLNTDQEINAQTGVIL